MIRKLQVILLFAAALLMSFSAFVTATVSVPHLREDLIEINVRPTLILAIMIGLHFGTFAMVGFAALVLASAIRAWRGVALDKASLAIIGIMYLGFGIAAFVLSGSHHTLGYVLISVLLLTALIFR
jgi:hypothetical protein